MKVKKLKFSKIKKIKRSVLKRKCDTLFSKLVRSIGYCQAKGKVPMKCGGPLQAAHLENRANLRLRWEVQNALCLCAAHHILYFHKHPLEFIEFLFTYFPDKMEFVKAHRNELATESLDNVYRRLKVT